MSHLHWWPGNWSAKIAKIGVRLDATIHLVIRTHGPVIPGMQMAQFGTLNGGCNPGEPNEGLCEDMQRVFY